MTSREEMLDEAAQAAVKGLTGLFAVLRGKSYAKDHYQLEVSHGLYNELRDVRDQLLAALRSQAGSAAAQREALNDLQTHRSAWRDAIVKQCTPFGSDDDGSYWDHELRAFDRTFEALTTATQSPPKSNDAREIAERVVELCARVAETTYLDEPSNPAFDIMRKATAKAIRERALTFSRGGQQGATE